ncbi:MAG: histidine phosphatase family protein [Woeseiaceae bacterium]
MAISELEKQARRERRKKRRMLAILLFVLGSVGLAWFFESQATTTLIFVRHAEKQSEPADNPGLTVAGTQRALTLQRAVADIDVVAAVDAVYASPYRRTIDTARPTARAAGLEIQPYDVNSLESEINAIVERHKGEIVLIVGHSNTIAPMIAELGGSKKLPPIGEMEYDNLYVVTIPWFGKVKTLRFHYGATSTPAAP